MPKQATKKPLLRALAGETLEAPPFWLMRQAGRYLPEYRTLRAQAGDFLGLCYTPELAAEVTLQPIRRYAMDAAILFSDILVVPDALGQSVTFAEGEGPLLEPICGIEDLARLDRSRLHDHLAPVYETVRRVKSALPDDVALIGFAGAPWTVASYMVEGGGSKDYARAKAWAYGEPDGFQKLIDILVSATGDYLVAQIDAGAEVVQIFDSWAGVFPDDAFARWVAAPIQAVIARVKARHPDVPVIAFPRGAGIAYDGFAAATGADAIGLDTTVPLGWAADVLQKQTPVQGNLDPRMLAIGGAAMRDEVARILAALAPGPFVFNLGHGIDKITPLENVAALAEQIRAWPGAAL